ncbi:MAG: hypothetical protein QOK43_2843 [Acidimicrobiaceae bacterium]|nr:hypothetical protein [Acidimicrobiaceae bacterium]
MALGAAVFAAAAVGVPGPAHGGAAIQLPVRRPPVARSDPLELLGTTRPGETVSHAPGPVDDREIVHVGLAPDGTVVSVKVDQILTVSGVGDFEMRVLGPVDDVDAPAEQSPQPGLRRQTVTWQGFSPGAKTLRSTLTLQAAFERNRLPLAVTVADDAVTLRNGTTLPAAFAVGTPDAAAVSRLAEGVRGRLAAGLVPVAGEDGLPSSLDSRTPVGEERVYVTVPVHVTGTVGNVSIDVVVADTPIVVPVSAPLPARAPAAGGGVVHLRIAGALPTLPPGAGLREVQTALAQAARLVDLDAFVGVTVAGPSTTVYEYGPAPKAATPPPPPPDRPADRATLAWSAVAAMALAALGRSIWLRS